MSEFVDRLAARANQEGLVDVAYATVDTPLGTGLVAATPKGLVRVALPNERIENVLAQLAEGVSPRVLEFPTRLDEARRELDEYFEGRRDRFELPLDWRLSHPGFYRRVLRATARVPFGEVITYGEAAVAIDWLYIPQGFGRALDLLSWDCEQRGEPSLACLFVRQGDGEVGSGFVGTVEEAEAGCTECFNRWAR